MLTNQSRFPGPFVLNPKIIQCPHGRFLDIRYQVGIGVQGQGNGGMAEPFLNDFWIDTFGQQQGGMGMAQVMEGKIMDTQFCQNRQKIASLEIAGGQDVAKQAGNQCVPDIVPMVPQAGCILILEGAVLF